MKAIYNEDGDEIINFEMPSEEEMSQVTPHIISRYEQPSCGGSCSGCSAAIIKKRILYINQRRL